MSSLMANRLIELPSIIQKKKKKKSFLVYTILIITSVNFQVQETGTIPLFSKTQLHRHQA